ncbi:prolyl 4-hydroxylase subunit alpha-2 [Drosophila bipectinata]|uniref:prolyl 4-hydroxylase subunit alpha-2 n=1 Tax=Drosophila bipectinata TaxID=42026 RepID=UPI0038B4133F
MLRFLEFLVILLCLGSHSVWGIKEKSHNESRYYSSTVQLLKLLKLEHQFVENFKNHSEKLGDNLKAYLISIKYKENQTINEKVEYVSNPLNAYMLLRRTREELPKWLDYFKKQMGNDDIFKELDELVPTLPDHLDLREAMLGLQRIETTYGLRVDDLAYGILQGKQYDIQLSYRDRVAMGHLSFKRRNYKAAAQWYRMACKHDFEDNKKLLNEVLGNPSDFLHRQYIKALFVYGISISGEDETEEAALLTIENSLDHVGSQRLQKQIETLHSSSNDDEIMQELYQTKPPVSTFEQGCRFLYPPKRNLFCRYNFTTTPFLRLAPLKLEEINLDPYVVMYHEVLYETEIEELKKQSNHLQNGYADEKNGSMFRAVVAQHSWWSDKSPIREKVNQRIKDMTGLDFPITDELQVANYGCGTYFKPHYDYTSDGYETPNSDTLGDRLGTIIFYASDVLQGGATVFPDIKVSIAPRKGSSVFWYNLYDDGRPDIRSRHSVCPVINGDRWTLTKWIHIFPQMFIIPCGPRK